MSGGRERSSGFQGGNVPSWGGGEEKGREREGSQPLECVSHAPGLKTMEILPATQEEEALPKPAADSGH